MNIKPLSFNYPMVQALKERTKTVTRRLQTRESFLSFFEAIYGMALVTKNPRVWRYEFEYAERPNTEEFMQDFKILNLTQNQFQTSNF